MKFIGETEGVVDNTVNFIWRNGEVYLTSFYRLLSLSDIIWTFSSIYTIHIYIKEGDYQHEGEMFKQTFIILGSGEPRPRTAHNCYWPFSFIKCLLKQWVAHVSVVMFSCVLDYLFVYIISLFRCDISYSSL